MIIRDYERNVGVKLARPFLPLFSVEIESMTNSQLYKLL
jgi:hypothetical protein